MSVTPDLGSQPPVSSDDSLALVQAQYKTSATIFGSNDPAEVLRAMSDFTDQRFSHALLGLIDNVDAPTELHILAETGPDGVERVDRTASLRDYPAHEGLAALETLAVEDSETDAFLTDVERARLQEQRIRALVIAPLVVGQRLIGMIAFTHDHPAALSPARLRALRNLADQMAIVLDNQRLLRDAQEATERLSQQVRVLETLNQLATSAATVEDEKPLFDQAIEGMVKALEISHGSFTLFNETNEFARVISEYPATGAVGLELDMRNNALFDALFEVVGRPIVVQDVETDARVTPAALEIFHMLGIKGLIIAPLVVRGDIVGSIGLDKYDADQQFTDRMLEIVETIGAQVSTGLQSIRLLRDIRLQATREATVNAISTRLQRSNHVEGVLTEAARGLQQALQLHQVVIRLGTSLDLKLNQTRVDGVTLDGDSLSMKAVWTPELSQASETRQPIRTLNDERETVAVPIILRGDVIGAFEVEPQQASDPALIDVLQAVADRLALSLDNACLFEQSQSVAFRERKASEVANLLIGATDVRSVLQLAAESLNAAMGAVYTRVHLQPGVTVEGPLAPSAPSRGEAAP